LRFSRWIQPAKPPTASSGIPKRAKGIASTSSGATAGGDGVRHLLPQPLQITDVFLQQTPGGGSPEDLAVAEDEGLPAEAPPQSPQGREELHAVSGGDEGDPEHGVADDPDPVLRELHHEPVGGVPRDVPQEEFPPEANPELSVDEEVGFPKPRRLELGKDTGEELPVHGLDLPPEPPESLVDHHGGRGEVNHAVGVVTVGVGVDEPVHREARALREPAYRVGLVGEHRRVDQGRPPPIQGDQGREHLGEPRPECPDPRGELVRTHVVASLAGDPVLGIMGNLHVVRGDSGEGNAGGDHP